MAFAILLGVGLLQAGESARPLSDLLRSGYVVIMRMIAWVLRLTPIGIFALLAHLVATVGVETLIENLLAFSLVVIGGTLFHAVVTLPAFAYFLAGVRPGELFRGLRDALLVAFSTSSSAATLPVTTRCVEENLGVRRSVSSFVLPLGATVNMDGTSVYQVMALVFLISLFGDIAGVSVTVGTLTSVALLVVLYSVGTPGVPGGSVKVIQDVLTMFGIPPGVIGIILPMDRLLDMSRSAVNVSGDLFTAGVTDRLCRDRFTASNKNSHDR